MDAIVGTNVRVQVQSTLGADKTVSGIAVDTSGDGTVTTSGSHGYTTGDFVVFSVSEGMVQLDGQAARISAASGSTFTIEGLDMTGFDTWVSGTVNKVTAFQTYQAAQNVTMPNPAPTKLDKTTLLDKVKQYVYALPDAPDGQVTGLFNPTGTAEGLVRAATNNNDTMVMKIVFANDLTLVFNANVSGGTGFDLPTNAIATATTAFTPKAQVLFYAD